MEIAPRRRESASHYYGQVSEMHCSSNTKPQTATERPQDATRAARARKPPLGTTLGSLGVAKQLALSVGLYAPAPALNRVFSPSECRNFREHRSLLSRFVRPGDLLFDVGANIGNKSEILLSLGARVVAFEPPNMLP